MRTPERPLRAGKLDLTVLRHLLARHPILDPRVVLGPKVGEDAAVLDPGGLSDSYWVVTSDPVTFTTEDVGYYGVVVNLNDIATRGAVPRWLLATLLFPEGTHLPQIERVFDQINDACQRFAISLVGGHTEITPGIEKAIFSGHMIGEVKKDRLVATSGARVDDSLLLIKGICIEGTSILAREKEGELLAKGLSRNLVEKAKRYVFDPGIEVLRAARVACNTVPVHSMHDPTEGGLINGIVEMAIASEKEIRVDLSRVPIYEESRILCREYGLDPFGVIASGALLLTLSASDLGALRKALESSTIPFEIIGEVKEGPARVLAREGDTYREIQPFPQDEILKVLEQK